MKLRVMFTGALCALTLFAFAQHEHGHGAPAPDPAMEAMIKAGTPGDPHKKLDVFTGTWETEITMWMAPGAPPAKSRGVAENRMIMDGRYLEQRYKGEFFGEPFEGIGYTGYDNVRKQYWGTWMDNMSTAMMVSTGALSADGKTWTFKGTTPDPMTGKDSWVDEKITVSDADHHTMEMWGPGPDGKSYKMMEIAYTRKK